MAVLVFFMITAGNVRAARSDEPFSTNIPNGLSPSSANYVLAAAQDILRMTVPVKTGSPDEPFSSKGLPPSLGKGIHEAAQDLWRMTSHVKLAELAGELRISTPKKSRMESILYTSQA